MTVEEQAAYDAVIAERDELQTANENLTAERDSLTEENQRLITEAAARTKELAETKKLNFTLARKIDVSQPAKGPEDWLHDMFGGD